MKNIYCHKCATIVGQAEGSLKIKRGTVHSCKECHDKKTMPTDLPDFLKGLAANRRTR